MKISSKLLDLFRQNSSFIISGHIHPEGDSLGSCLALALGLKKLGKDVCVISRDPVSETMRFLPSSKTIKLTPPKREFDVAVLVDCNEIKRTGFESFNAKKLAIIDHHVLTSEAADSAFYRSVAASLIDPEAAAAGLLVYKVLTALNAPIDRNIATNLYTAILTDTGGFRYSNASAESLKVAGLLVEAGARPWDISREVYESFPYRSMKLLGLSLATIDRDNGIAWINTTKAMFKKTGTSAEHAEDFVDFPRKVRGVEVAVFFRQDRERVFKISLRSKGRINVQRIAKGFGGGGHIAAAGCTVNGTYKEVQDKVFRAVRKALKEK
ncbi:MAG: bifunctional oligoribonuclease/PAP phosphatase NrnA [Nitrospirota bacterium]|nr:bifunctional oligoribonuclease/PAP phosphatase NrnA [Nitrospirota bacterium]